MKSTPTITAEDVTRQQAIQEMERRHALYAEGRTRVLYLRETMLLDLLWFVQNPIGRRLELITPDLPADALLDRVFFEPSRCAFGALFYHESFEMVPCGAAPPALDEVGELRVLEGPPLPPQEREGE